MARKKEVSQDTGGVSILMLEKTTIQKAYEYSLKKGYKAVIEGGVLLFPQSEDNEKITKDLIGQFGYDRKEEESGVMKTVKRLPFSYGFTPLKLFSKESAYVAQDEEEVGE